MRYRAATVADVPAMEACRAGDAAAGPADARMAGYLQGTWTSSLTGWSGRT